MSGVGGWMSGVNGVNDDDEGGMDGWRMDEMR